MEKYVRLNALISKEQKAFLTKKATKEISESALVRDAIYKVYKIK